jgi:hypothetical protein
MAAHGHIVSTRKSHQVILFFASDSPLPPKNTVLTRTGNWTGRQTKVNPIAVKGYIWYYCTKIIGGKK